MTAFSMVFINQLTFRCFLDFLILYCSPIEVKYLYNVTVTNVTHFRMNMHVI